MPGIKAEHNLAEMLRAEIGEMLGRGRNPSFPGILYSRLLQRE